MRPNEANYLGQLLAKMPIEQISPVLNLGSSTPAFEAERPHIHQHIFGPLKARGVHVLNMDLKDAPGVDIVGDIFETKTQEAARAVGAKLLLCCNILEHVEEPYRFADVCGSLLGKGGIVVATVPYSYPLHLDPIDTYFRPTPAEVAQLFGGFSLIEGQIVSDSTYWADLRAEKTPTQLLTQAVSHLLKLPFPYPDFDQWKARYHRYLWLLRPYRVSCVLLRRTH